MRHHTNCADWTYETHPERSTTLAGRCKRLTSWISTRPRRFDRYGFDTRPGHRLMFAGLTPTNCSCVVGHYRGDPSCEFLVTLDVTTKHDPRVGVPAILVSPTLAHFETRCRALVETHNRWLATKGSTQPPRNALIRFVSVLADILQQFLTIHPYMDGNGHAARLLTYTMMARAGYLPANWDIDAKQPYSDALSAHRSGKPGALEAFLLSAITG